MSYNHPYQKPQDDFSPHHDMYTDSQPMYHRESGAYGSRIRTMSSEQTHSSLSASLEELSALPPGKALSFLQSCGLDADDLKTLAELPEHLMSAEKLPELLAEIKKKKVASMSSSRSTMLQHSSSGLSWEDRRLTQPVEYSLDLPVHQSYSHHREQVQTSKDQWGNVQPSSSPTCAYASSESNFVVEYNHLKDDNAYFDKPSYATESREKTAVVSQSYSNYSRDISQSSYVSSRDTGQPSYLSSRDIGEPSHLSSRDVGQPSHLSSRNVGQPSHLSNRKVGQHSHLSSRDVGQPSHLSSRDVGEPLHLSSRDARQPSRLVDRDIGQPSDLLSRDVGQLSHMSNRDVGQVSQLSSRTVAQSSHLPSRNVGQPSQVSSRNVRQPSQLSSRNIGPPSLLSSRNVGPPSLLSSRNLGPPSLLSSRNVGPPSLLSSRNVGPPSLLSSRNIGPPSLLSSRNIGQPSQLSSKNVTQPSYLSSRDFSQLTHLSSIDITHSSYQSSRNISLPSHLSSRDVGQPSHHRRKEVRKVPTRKEASDFHGKTPPVFPYACVLCEITVLSNKDWSVHIKGPQHANSQLSLVDKYPEWDQRMQSARRNEPISEKPQSRISQEQGETSSSRNGSSSNRSGLSSSKTSRNLNEKKVKKEKSKVVYVKFELDEVDEAYLRQLLGQFGAIAKLIVLPQMAFVEMGSTDQAEDIVKYFLHNPLRVQGHLLEFSLSAASSFSQSSCVVSFMPLPAGEGIHSELIAIAKRFGSVKHSLFLPSRGYVEMSNAQEASKLVEHYSTNSLKLKGKTIHVNFSTEYQKLGGKGGDELPISRSSNRRRSLSPQKRSYSSRRDSPSPKRRVSTERSRSRRCSDSKKRDGHQRSKERSRESSSRRDSSSKPRCRKSTLKDQSKQTDKTAEEKTEGKMDQSDTACDSDLEGVAVIADDCEELNSESEEFIEIDHEDQPDDEEQDYSAALTKQEVCEDTQDIPDDTDTLSDLDMTNMLSENSESIPKAVISDESSDWKEAEELQHNPEAPEEITVDISGGSSQSKEVQNLQQIQYLQKDRTEETSHGPSECKDAHKLQERQNDETIDISDGSSECKEAQVLQENREGPKDKTIDISDGLSKEAQEHQQNQEMQKDKTEEISDGPSCKNTQEIQQNNKVQKDETKAMEQEASDFPMNLENCITLDEFTEEMTEQNDEQESSIPSAEEEYGRVLEVKGFPLAKKYTEADLLHIGRKCGKVADCCLVRSSRKVEKALIEMVNAADASKLEAESKQQNFKLGGKVLRITVSSKYSRVNERLSTEFDSGKAENNKPVEESNEEVSCLVTSCEDISGIAEMETSEECAKAQKETNLDTIMHTCSDEEAAYGKVLRIRNLPFTDEYTDAEFVSIAECYGKVRRHWLFRPHHKGLIEMENASDAEKVVAAANMNEIVLGGKHPVITVSMKHSHLNKSYFLNGSSDSSLQTPANEKDESKTQNLSDQGSSQTSLNVEETSNDNQGVNSKDVKQESASEDSVSISEPAVQLKDAVGTEFVRPVVGYFCSLCNVIYASEEEAKEEHCRTILHHQKHKEHMEQNSSK